MVIFNLIEIDCKVDKPSLPTSPGSSIPNSDTPVSIKILRAERKKHNSAIGIRYFSSPHETDSPQQRSRLTGIRSDFLNYTIQ